MIDIDDLMTVTDFETTDVNLELKTNTNGSHIEPRLQEPRSEKITTTGLVKKLIDDVKATNCHIMPRYTTLDAYSHISVFSGFGTSRGPGSNPKAVF